MQNYSDRDRVLAHRCGAVDGDDLFRVEPADPLLSGVGRRPEVEAPCPVDVPGVVVDPSRGRPSKSSRPVVSSALAV